MVAEDPNMSPFLIMESLGVERLKALKVNADAARFLPAMKNTGVAALGTKFLRLRCDDQENYTHRQEEMNLTDL
jgi:hypothetical protein